MICDPRVDDPHTTLEAVVEVTLSSATSKNLGLDDHVLALCRKLATKCCDCQVFDMRTNGLCDRLGLLCVVSDIALGDVDAVLFTDQPRCPPCGSLSMSSIPSRGAGQSATRG